METKARPIRVQIPRMDHFDEEIFRREYSDARIPVCIKGAARAWPAISKWTPDYFVEHYGDVQISSGVNLPDLEVPYTSTDRNHRQKMSVREFVQRMRGGDRCYLDQCTTDFFAKLADDYDFGLFRPVDIHVIALWLGARTNSGLHYDWVDNFFVQVQGTKKAILARPEDIVNLYPFEDCHSKSQVAPVHPDMAAHPRLAQVCFFEELLEPGDLLFIPRGWWHYFTAPDVSISLSCWFGPSRGPKDELASVVQARNPKLWLKTVEDFFKLGVLGKPYENRLFSLPPTGIMLHQIVSEFWNSLRAPKKA